MSTLRALLLLPMLLLASCVTIPDRPLSPEEQKLVGTWSATLRVPAPYTGMPMDQPAVIQIHPNRTSRFTCRRLFHGDQVQDRRWELVNGILRETSGLAITSVRCTFIGDQAFRVDQSDGSSHTWKRFSTSSVASTWQARERERSSTVVFPKQRSESYDPYAGSTPEYRRWAKAVEAELAQKRSNDNGSSDWLDEDIRRSKEREAETQRRAYSLSRRQR